MDGSRASEQLEEGEIVDDVFEDISDNSIIESICGKLVSPNGHLRALSLSSGNETTKNTKRRKKLLRKRKVRCKKRKRTRVPSESSDSDKPECLELKGKLKEAIHINGEEGSCKNTLEERLKAMSGLAPEPTPLTPAKDNADNTDDKFDDNELENLRIEALKTAVLNKFERRKKKKAQLEVANDPAEILNNKENDTPKEEIQAVKSADKEVGNGALDIEEDEDVLRAALLAGLAKKITRAVPTPKTQVKPSPIRLPVTRVLPKRPIANFKKNTTKKILPKPQVKPLIINVNDSESDEDFNQKLPSGPPKLTDLHVIADNVEKFLKEQRAKFETEKKKLQTANKNKETNLEKSSVKLLPKSQQIEYLMLLKKLKYAERKKRLKNLALKQRKADEPPKPLVPVVEVSSKEEEEVAPAAETEVDSKEEITTANYDAQPSEESSAEKKKGGIIDELTTLQKTLKEIKMQRNGSLQIKSKYQVLTPIIRKITATSNERKKHEKRIKTLMQELNEAKSSLTRSHQRFTILVRELVEKKAQLESLEDSKPKIDTLKDSAKGENNVKSEEVVPGKEQLSCVENTVSSSTCNDYEDMDVCNSNSDDMEYQIDIVDPNDIDQIFTRRPLTKPGIPEYVSPLNVVAYERYTHVDPLGIMCPYEMDGSCRDIDCTFKHYLKSHERL